MGSDTSIPCCLGDDDELESELQQAAIHNSELKRRLSKEQQAFNHLKKEKQREESDKLIELTQQINKTSELLINEKHQTEKLQHEFTQLAQHGDQIQQKIILLKLENEDLKQQTEAQKTVVSNNSEETSTKSDEFIHVSLLP
eukprot:226325_1